MKDSYKMERVNSESASVFIDEDIFDGWETDWTVKIKREITFWYARKHVVS